MRDKLKGIAAKQLNVLPEDVELAGGKIRSRSNPDNALPFGRVAATSHWSPAMLPESMAPALSETGDMVAAGTRAADERRQDQHVADLRLHLRHVRHRDRSGELSRARRPLRVDARCRPHAQSDDREGQIRGAFAQGIAAALYEEFTYNEEGAFLSGTFADYLVPTVSEIPEVEILHYESPSPLTPLGAKGLAEGNCMSTPVCIANAIADALGVARRRAAGNAAAHPRDDGRRREHEAAAVRLRAARYGRRGRGAARRARRRRAHPGRRPVAGADAQSAFDRRRHVDRYFADRRARCHPRPRRH